MRDSTTGENFIYWNKTQNDSIECGGESTLLSSRWIVKKPLRTDGIGIQTFNVLFNELISMIHEFGRTFLVSRIEIARLRLICLVFLDNRFSRYSGCLLRNKRFSMADFDWDKIRPWSFLSGSCSHLKPIRKPKEKRTGQLSECSAFAIAQLRAPLFL